MMNSFREPREYRNQPPRKLKHKHLINLCLSCTRKFKWKFKVSGTGFLWLQLYNMKGSFKVLREDDKSSGRRLCGDFVVARKGRGCVKSVETTCHSKMIRQRKPFASKQVQNRMKKAIKDWIYDDDEEEENQN
ncbi:hypothetical protein NC651_036916 [Populus alba x Populus x berolinensis]|nr:hypothetical protein NC651_036916 [Populus alba x Populus x berolinensis]